MEGRGGGRQEAEVLRLPSICLCVCLLRGACVCLYVYECVCVSVCGRCLYGISVFYVSVCIYVCVCVYMGDAHVGYVCLCVHASACTYVFLYMCSCAPLCVYMCVSVYVCLCVSVQGGAHVGGMCSVCVWGSMSHSPQDHLSNI